MSSFDRHPLRADYEAAAVQFAPRRLGGSKGARSWDVPISAQNRRVRFAVDLQLARAKEFPARETRQLRRQVARLGTSAFIPEYIAGPDEV